MAYTTIDDPSAHFYTYAFSKSSGTGSATFDANSDLQPDFLWVKSRTNADSHELWDSSRGVNSTLFSDNTSAEDTAANRIVSFDTDGFTWGNAGNLNAAGNFVSWAWKANAGSTSSNTDGTLTSTVQANTDAGFSIVEYTTGSIVAGSGGYFSVGHGLGVTPDMVITKRLSGTSNWWTWHQGLTNDTTSFVYLDGTAAEGNVGDMWGNGMTSSVFGGGAGSHYSSSDYVAYCFAEKQGYSKFGTYVGNGNTNGAFIYTGFRPAFIMIKPTNTTGYWVMFDNSRDIDNPATQYLLANTNDAEQTDTGIDFCSNGIKLRSTGGSINASGNTHIYMAFAENPFVTSTGIPTTAR
jgi:hypothetical protein